VHGNGIACPEDGRNVRAEEETDGGGMRAEKGDDRTEWDAGIGEAERGICWDGTGALAGGSSAEVNLD
jgi:hypothetical protein